MTWNLEGPPGEIARPPEIMCHDASCGLESRANVLVVGPGLGLDHDAERLLEASCRAGTPVVFDADALTMLAEGRLADVARSCDGVMTPHPAEAGRLLGCTTSEVQSDRLKAAKALCDAWGHTIVLKGACTLIASVDSPIIMITSGDPTLAAGGTGDVLAGVIGALMAQGLSAHDAAVVAAFVHGCAGVRAGQRGDRRGALASEIADTVPAILGELVAGWQP